MRSAFIAGGALVVLALFPTGSPAGAPVGIEDRSGLALPPGISLRDEAGRSVTLGEMADRPLILALVYYSCGHLCPQLLGELAEALSRVPLEPGVDYRVVTASIDERDTPAQAAQAKVNYLHAARGKLPDSSWSFLTGESEDLGRLAEATGFRWLRRREGFYHPLALVVIAPGGTISGYIPLGRSPSGGTYRSGFLPSELEIALTGAGEGRRSASRPGLPVVCFPHERLIELDFFRMLKVFGSLNLLAVAGVFAWLALGRRRKGGAGHD